MPSSEATLQVNVTPSDLAHAARTVPHQLRQLGGQVDDVLLSVDLGPRAAADALGTDPACGELRDWIDALRRAHPSERIVARQVDYSPAATRLIADTLFAGRAVPATDFRGRPIHAYLEPMLRAGTPWVLHLDSDMLVGGGSPTWLAEAQAALASDDRYVLASPYPGPPRPDGRVLRQRGAEQVERDGTGPAVLVPNMSSRVFLVHVPTFVERLAPLPLLGAPLKGRLWTLRQPNPPYEKLELMVTARMVHLGLRRIDLLGRPPGMWSLHPPYRSTAFYERLPELVHRVETGDLPEEQAGDFDLNDSVLDWSDARRAIRRERTMIMLRGERRAR
ncbi:MAG: hypothetical protein ACJ74O_08945 [Frankiaceae bacterium]